VVVDHPQEPPKVARAAAPSLAQPRDISRALGHALNQAPLLGRLGVPRTRAFVSWRPGPGRRDARVDGLGHALVLGHAARSVEDLDAILAPASLHVAANALPRARVA